MSELPKTFDPASIEARWYQHWEANGLFRPERPEAEPWTIVNPPPNVTGSLHIGHALDNTLQDILTRHARLKGKDALWVVGTDHAGIATQMVVERQLNAAGQKRTDFTRDAFIERVWQWKAESGGQITAQLRRLGCSMDWANERFTMDEGFSKAVLKVFVDLHKEGLLYRDKRLVNWDPGLGTAISDLEVETREVRGSFWRLRYPLADGSGFIEVATTRPETMLADMAVAVHPEDARYTALVGKQVRLPITGRLIPIVADEHADPELGSGAVKITPGHDFNDFEVGRRAGIEARDMLNMLDAKASVTQVADGLIPAELLDLPTADARKAVVARLKAEGFLIPHVDKDGVEHDAEPRTIQTPYGDRSGVVIEPWLTDQWYVDAATLAKPAIEAVRSGAIRIVPKTWEKTFFNWMENIQPWCVSRQLWWGHRIPAWFGPSVRGDTYDYDTLQPFVADTEEQALALAQELYGKPLLLVDDRIAQINSVLENPAKPFGYRDPDVLDTWFSSALWPFATLGWPHDAGHPHPSAASPLPPSPIGRGKGPAAAGGGKGEGESHPPFALNEVEGPVTNAGEGASTSLSTNGAGGGGPGNRHRQLHGRYPNDVLISGFDILFFWNARMMMQGIHFMKDVPFRTLYLHGLVRAADGAKMSKSKGNTVDPLGLIDKYGADALRFFMAAMESQGRDIKMDERRVEGYRNFATKLWNASRFCQANGIGGSTTLEPPAATLAVNKWIVGKAIAAIQEVDLALADYRFDAAANAIYQFVWSQFCDWYLELIKPVLGSTPDSVRPQPVEGLSFSDEKRAWLRQAPGERDVGAPVSEAEETRAVAGWVLDQILVVLHPFMPFITEELWHALAERDHDLIVARWPMADARSIDPEAAAELEWLIKLVGEVRSSRTELNVPPGARLPYTVDGAGAGTTERLGRNAPTIARLARIEPGEVSGGTAQVVVDEATFRIALGDVIDLTAERARLAKAIAAAEKERDALAGRLGNASFVERAKPEAVEKARADHADKAAEAERLAAALSRLA